MTIRSLTLTLGTHETARRKAALESLCQSIGAIGRNGVPSISEMLSRIADAADHDLNRTAALMSQILAVAAQSEADKTAHPF